MMGYTHTHVHITVHFLTCRTHHLSLQNTTAGHHTDFALRKAGFELVPALSVLYCKHDETTVLLSMIAWICTCRTCVMCTSPDTGSNEQSISGLLTITSNCCPACYVTRLLLLQQATASHLLHLYSNAAENIVPHLSACPAVL